jgi:arsenite-transporting ATPase
MRVILYTGKGGVGKTSLSAATAVHCAESGYRTVILSTDAAHSLADSFDMKIGDRLVKLADNLFAQEVNVQRELRDNWGIIKLFITDSLRKKGMDELMAEEFAIFPGLEELFSLLRLKELHDGGEYDVAIIDCAPTGAAIRMLGVPGVFRWYFDKFFHLERRIAKVIKPVVERMYDEVLIPTDEVFYSVEEIYERVYALNEVLTDPDVTSVRLVCSPESMVIKESQRAYTYLNLFGYGVDAVIANRVLPEVAENSYFYKWKKIQQKHLRFAEQTFQPLNVLRSPLFDNEMVGIKQLKMMSQEVFGDLDPTAVFHKEKPFTIEKKNGGVYLSVRIPYARKEQIGAWVKGEELFLEWGDFKANTLLPTHLLGMNLKNARYKDGYLRITFEEKKDE